MESLCTDSATQLVCLREVVLTQLKKGAFFGELAVMFVALANLLLIFCQLILVPDFQVLGCVGMCWVAVWSRAFFCSRSLPGYAAHGICPRSHSRHSVVPH